MVACTLVTTDSADTAECTERAARTSVESQLDEGTWPGGMVRADQSDAIRRADRADHAHSADCADSFTTSCRADGRYSATDCEDTDKSRRATHISHAWPETDRTFPISVGGNVSGALFVDFVAQHSRRVAERRVPAATSAEYTRRSPESSSGAVPNATCKPTPRSNSTPESVSTPNPGNQPFSIPTTTIRSSAIPVPGPATASPDSCRPTSCTAIATVKHDATTATSTTVSSRQAHAHPIMGCRGNAGLSECANSVSHNPDDATSDDQHHAEAGTATTNADVSNSGRR